MQTVRASKIFHEPGLMLVAVESIEFLHSHGNVFGHMYGRIEPLALVICRQDGIRAIDMQAGSIAVERLRSEVPGLDELLATFVSA